MLPDAVHVMDRRADSYALLEEMLLRPQSRGANYSSRIVINVDPGRLAAAPAAHEVSQRGVAGREPRHKRRPAGPQRPK